MNPLKRFFNNSWNRARYKQLASFEIKKLDLLSHRLNHDISLTSDKKFWEECLASLKICSQHYPKCRKEYEHYSTEYKRYAERFCNKKET